MYKRFLVIFSCLIFAILFSALTQRNAELVPVMTIPVTNKTIVIDAGHGIPDEGAENDDGISEAKINLRIANKLKSLLDGSGSKVVMTRTNDNAVYDEKASSIAEKKVSDIKNRVKIGNNSNADIFVSIHLNMIPQEQYWGWQTFYKDGSEDSKRLANCIQNSLTHTISTENKRTAMKINNVYIMKYVEIPIVIVECGFLSNKEESAKLVTDEYQDKIAWGIYGGILDYFG